MLKYIVGIVVSLVALTFIRAVWGIIQKALVDEVKAATGGDAAPAGSMPPKPPPTTETTLRKCVACGTYKPEASMIRYGSGAKSIFFCSSDCEKKANG